MLVYLQIIESEEDKSKFEQIYLHYQDLMFHIADGILHNEQDAEDTVYQAFVNLAENIEKISDPICSKTKFYIVIIVEHKAIDRYRRKSKLTMVEFQDEASGIPVSAPEYSGGAGVGSPSVLSACPEECRHVFSLSFEKKMRRLLRKQRHPFAHRMLQRAAAIFLTALVGIGTWLAVDMQARAAFFRWCKEVYENQVIYRFYGEQRGQTDVYRPAWLPDGYEEDSVFDPVEGSTSVIY